MFLGSAAAFHNDAFFSQENDFPLPICYLEKEGYFGGAVRADIRSAVDLTSQCLAREYHVEQFKFVLLWVNPNLFVSVYMTGQRDEEARFSACLSFLESTSNLMP